MCNMETFAAGAHLETKPHNSAAKAEGLFFHPAHTNRLVGDNRIPVKSNGGVIEPKTNLH